MKSTIQLYEEAYASLHIAADVLSNAAAPSLTEKFTINTASVRRALVESRVAICRLQKLDNVLSGEPEPKSGD
jgi:hypothetical protein